MTQNNEQSYEQNFKESRVIITGSEKFGITISFSCDRKFPGKHGGGAAERGRGRGRGKRERGKERVGVVEEQRTGEATVPTPYLSQFLSLRYIFVGTVYFRQCGIFL